MVFGTPVKYVNNINDIMLIIFINYFIENLGIDHAVVPKIIAVNREIDAADQRIVEVDHGIGVHLEIELEAVQKINVEEAEIVIEIAEVDQGTSAE